MKRHIAICGELTPLRGEIVKVKGWGSRAAFIYLGRYLGRNILKERQFGRIHLTLNQLFVTLK